MDKSEHMVDEDTQPQQIQQNFYQQSIQYKIEGNKFFSEKQYNNAIQQYQKGIQLLSQQEQEQIEQITQDLVVILYSNTSQCQLNLKKPEQAFNSIEKALKIDPTHQKSLVRKAKALKELQLYQESMDILEEQLQVNSQNKEIIQLIKEIKQILDKPPDMNMIKRKAKVEVAKQLVECFSSYEFPEDNLIMLFGLDQHIKYETLSMLYEMGLMSINDIFDCIDNNLLENGIQDTDKNDQRVVLRKYMNLFQSNIDFDLYDPDIEFLTDDNAKIEWKPIVEELYQYELIKQQDIIKQSYIVILINQYRQYGFFENFAKDFYFHTMEAQNNFINNKSLSQKETKFQIRGIKNQDHII